jgi:Tuberculosis necrotizing toxin
VTLTVAAARARLDAAGVLDRDVLLPGDNVSPRQGAIRVVHDAAWEVRAEEYGRSVLLARASDEAEALEYTVDRVTAPLPEPMAYPADRLRLQSEQMARMVAPIAERLRAQPGVVVESQLPEGAVVDRVGALDGQLLYPVGLPMPQRSLPPDVFDPRLAHNGVVTLGVVAEVPVLATLVAPWFGQPGGGVVLRLEGADQTVRDAVRRGALRLLDIVRAEPHRS